VLVHELHQLIGGWLYAPAPVLGVVGQIGGQRGPRRESRGFQHKLGLRYAIILYCWIIHKCQSLVKQAATFILGFWGTRTTSADKFWGIWAAEAGHLLLCILGLWEGELGANIREGHW
jgi:hypothetical protein